MILGATGRDTAGKRRKDALRAALSRWALAAELSFLRPRGRLRRQAAAAGALRRRRLLDRPALLGPLQGDRRDFAVAVRLSRAFFRRAALISSPTGETLVDWRDEYVCFPSSAQCRAWVRESYRTHHRPEGYRACLLLR